MPRLCFMKSSEQERILLLSPFLRFSATEIYDLIALTSAPNQPACKVMGKTLVVGSNDHVRVPACKHPFLH